MNPLPPIPIPASRRWREFRLRCLPVLVFAAALGASSALWRQVIHTPGWPGGGDLSARSQFQLQPSSGFADLEYRRLKTPGQRASHHAQRGPATRPSSALTYGTGPTDLRFPIPFGLTPAGMVPPGNATGDKLEVNRN